jgi:two-component system OmpR family sensor kinase
MSPPRRLSLRTRMLVLLIGVTAIFLLVMGAVTTYVFNEQLTRNFRQNLAAEATQTANSVASNRRQYFAIEVVFRPYAVKPLTGSSAGTDALADAFSRMRPLRAYNLARLGASFTAPSSGGEPPLRVTAHWWPAADNSDGRPSATFVAQPVSVVTNQVRGLVVAELITGGALIALLAIGGEWLIGAGLDPLDKMAVTANEITSRGDLTARMPDASDGTEVGRLGSAINTMLDRIQQAFGARQRSEQRVREFAADASHELRTPLTTIRGYAELYRQGALGPDQLPSAMRRIEQEAQRMSTLVAELLELARLDRTSSLDLTETDLAAVVRDAVADAAAVEPDRPVRAEAPPRVVAVVDERRIRQVLANLLGNVRAHTPVTTPVAVRLGEITGGVLLEVADAGPGMSSEDAARAFDRFHRAAERPDSASHGSGGHSSASHGGDGSAGRGTGGPGRGDDGSGAHESGGSAGRESGGCGADDGAARQRQAGGRERGSKERATGGGSGLGLSIVQAIAAAHGGQATLESWPGRGTRVRIWLPDRAAP